jgi:hypothetical protein
MEEKVPSIKDWGGGSDFIPCPAKTPSPKTLINYF